MLERELVAFDPGPQLPIEEWSKAIFERYRVIRGLVTRHLANSADKRADSFNRGLDPRPWQLGMRVMRKESRGVSSKFVPRNTGPFRIGQILNTHKVILLKEDGTTAFGYPVPCSELIPIPERWPKLESGEGPCSIGMMLRGDGGPAPLAGRRDEYGKIGPGGFVLYQSPLCGKKEVVVGRVVDNNVADCIVKTIRFRGEWAQTRIRWTATEDVDFVRYQSIIREVSLFTDGALI